MRCKYLLLYGLLAVLPFSAQAGYKKIANGILVSLPEGELNQSKTVRLLVVNDEVIQVTASPEAKIQDKQSLVRVAPVKAPVKWNVESTSDSVFLNTGKLRAAVSLVTGEVTFYDMSGKLILRESNGGRQFTPIEVEGRKGYTTRQQFNSPEDEAFYGLGQHQSDEFNYNRKMRSCISIIPRYRCLSWFLPRIMVSYSITILIPGTVIHALIRTWISLSCTIRMGKREV